MHESNSSVENVSRMLKIYKHDHLIGVNMFSAQSRTCDCCGVNMRKETNMKKRTHEAKEENEKNLK